MTKTITLMESLPNKRKSETSSKKGSFIFVKVKIGSNKREVVQTDGNEYTVFLKERPIKGRANKELIELLEKHFNKEIKIISGKTSSKKLIKIG